MSDFDVKEKRFEEDIEDYLTHHGGYTKVIQRNLIVNQDLKKILLLSLLRQVSLRNGKDM